MPNFVTPPGINHPPIAKDDYVTMPMNTSIKINVLANDADPDNNTLTIVSNTAPSNGNAVINADKTITYTPNTGFVGSDSFQYTISDGHGGTATATVHVTVTGNVNKIHTAIMLKPILPSSVPWNATIMVQGKLVSTLTNMGIGNAKITFIGNGSGQIPFTITKSDGTFKAIGKAPVTAANHWIVQAKYPGNSTYTQSVSNPVSFNTLKHKTTLLLATSFGILDAGEDISFIAMLNDLNNGGSPIEEANIHFDGNGVIGVADQVTNGTGFAIAEGTAPSTTGTWNSQAHFSGVSTDPNDMNLYLPADSNIAKYVTVMHK